jgi:hypothetical protein
MAKPLAVVIGSIGKLPYAGMSLYWLHHIVGLQELGYDVHYVEHQGKFDKCYDPDADVMTESSQSAIDYLEKLLPRFGITQPRFSFIDRDDRCHGSGWPALRAALDDTEFVMTVASTTWFDELERCPRRAFIDGDPVFTQVAMATGDGTRGTAPLHYDSLFTYATRIGMPDCTLPTLGRRWMPARPVVATRLWDSTPGAASLPVTALMHWAAGSDVNYEGRVYGHKNREFERFIDLPRQTAQRFVLALGGGGPKDWMCEHGWELTGPLGATRTIEAYQRFIAGSRADFGLAKHAYVASRCGWFSDRSVCYLAAGRPVLHQDTGCSDWLPAGQGVFFFNDMADAVEQLQRLDADYTQNARAARATAEEHFEAAKVIGCMLDDAGFR